MQQCRACNTAVMFTTKPLEKLRSLCQWLPKHAALVNSITVEGASSRPDELGCERQSHLEAAQQLLHQALQAAAEVADAATAEATAAAAALPASSAAGLNDGILQQQEEEQQQRC